MKLFFFTSVSRTTFKVGEMCYKDQECTLYCVYHLDCHPSFFHLCYLRLEVIDKCFSHDTVEEIVDALVSDDSAAFFFTILTYFIV